MGGVSLSIDCVESANMLSDENLETETSERPYLDEEVRDLQMAIEESKRFAEEEAKAMKELRLAEARIKEAADARAKAEKKIIEAKAKATRDMQLTNLTDDASTSVKSMLVDSQTFTKASPLNAVEILLLQRYRAVEELMQGSNCHDVLPNGKKLRFEIISRDSSSRQSRNANTNNGKNRDHNTSSERQQQLGTTATKGRQTKGRSDNRGRK